MQISPQLSFLVTGFAAVRILPCKLLDPLSLPLQLGLLKEGELSSLIVNLPRGASGVQFCSCLLCKGPSRVPGDGPDWKSWGSLTLVAQPVFGEKGHCPVSD